MNILFLFVSSSDGGLFPSLIHEFAKHGQKVFVSSRGKDVEKTEVVDEGGIKVLRIKCPEFTLLGRVFIGISQKRNKYTLNLPHHIKPQREKNTKNMVLSFKTSSMV